MRVYFRRAGQLKLRLPTPIGSPAFWEAYRKAVAGEAPKKAQQPESRPQQNTMRWLVVGYYGSAEFKKAGRSHQAGAAAGARRFLEEAWRQAL